jgi:hypothetical protein
VITAMLSKLTGKDLQLWSYTARAGYFWAFTMERSPHRDWLDRRPFARFTIPGPDVSRH